MADSDIKQALDNVLSIIKGVKSHKSYMVGDRQYTARDIGELLKLYNQLKAEYNNELVADRLASGLGTGRKISVRF